MRSGILCIIPLARIEHGTGTGNGPFNLVGNKPDGLESGRCPQRDLDCLQATCHQGPRQRHGL